MACKVLVPFFAVVLLFSYVNCISNSEEKCLDYYKNGEVYNLNGLVGTMYAVYFWPPNQRQREDCEMINFKTLSPSEVYQAGNKCYSLNLSSEQPVVMATYKNSTGKIVNLLYYGKEEVKNSNFITST